MIEAMRTGLDQLPFEEARFVLIGVIRELSPTIMMTAARTKLLSVPIASACRVRRPVLMVYPPADGGRLRRSRAQQTAGVGNTI
jgi:hypothetical protein